MPRLLIVTTVPATLEAFLLPFARHYRARGWRVDALTRDEPLTPAVSAAFDQVWQVAWARNPLAPRNLLGTPGVIRRIVAGEGYDLVHVHTAVAAFVTRFALRGLRRSGRPQVIYTAHGFSFDQMAPAPQRLAFLGLERLAARWTDYQVVINRTDEVAALRYRLASRERICYMPGIGVDLGHYNDAQVSEAELQALRAELGLNAGERVVLMVAEFIPRKRHADLLRAFARLELPDVRLVLVGRGPLMEPTRALAAQLGIAERVLLLGQRQDIPSLLRAATLLVLPSQQEGLPRSILEAMALGVPVIGADIRGIRDLIDGGAGMLAPVGDDERLAQALASMLAHPEAAQAMARRARAAVDAYELGRVIALHDQLYARALQATPALIERALG
jgi:glycosyltransferase involved in cell wall biosynthesis